MAWCKVVPGVALVAVLVCAEQAHCRPASISLRIDRSV